MTPPLSRQRVLSTLETDGSRVWITPKLSRGKFLRQRRIIGYGLIALFVALPFVRIGGRPAFLIDLVTREISICGAVFRPTDGFLLMMLGLSVALTVFIVTALFGRVWCGYGCPQSVYLELVFRPIERFLAGPSRMFAKSRWRRAVKWMVFAAVSFALANVFLAYFVGTDRLATWVLESPGDHVGGFTVVVAVGVLVLFDFGYFREQTCILACPYGRLQSVLLDRQSLIIGYDARRGEPRAKGRKSLPVLQQVASRGDCIDCNACVATCPTGIDIRDGLQLECIGCAQCADACDGVMAKLGRAPHLIGYTSQDRLAGKPGRLLRGRTLVYPALLAITLGLFVWSTATHATTVVWVERHVGPSFVELPEGRVAAQIRLRLENETPETQHYTFALIDAPDATLRGAEFALPSRHALANTSYADVPRASFVHGRRVVHLRIASDRGFDKVVAVTLLGPTGATP